MKKHRWLRPFIVIGWIGLLMVILNLPTIFSNRNQNCIDVFTWGDYFMDESLIEKFEEQSGIKVNLHYYTTNEEMRIKLLSNKTSYDVVFPSDYAIRKLISEDALKPLDHSRLNFMDKLLPELTNLDHDPGNRYSLPNTWESYGFGYNKDEMHGNRVEPSLRSIFDESVINYKFAMPSDAGETLIFAATYLFGKKDRLNQSEAKMVARLLSEQKKHVEVYADYRSKYLIQTKNCPIALVRSSLVWQIAQENDFMGYVQPKEASFITIENIAIPKNSTKDDLVYTFINFLYEPQNQALHVEPNMVYPTRLDVLDYMDIHCEEYEKDLYFSLKNQPRFVFFKRLLSEEEMRNLWVDVKTSK